MLTIFGSLWDINVASVNYKIEWDYFNRTYIKLKWQIFDFQWNGIEVEEYKSNSKLVIFYNKSIHG